jgi:4-amino-4-deoxy-L-arabinose transferase-like glycosyltransferase
MLVVLPLACFLLLLISVLPNNCGSRLIQWGSAWLTASVIWGVLLVAITEALSALGALRTGWLAAAWAVAFSLSGILCARRRPSARLGMSLPSLNRAAFSLTAGAALAASAVGIIALIAAPNDTDSMKYHLMRVVHWMQDGNVAMYPAQYSPQLYDPPWAEYALLNLQSLSGGDHLANLVQWFSYAGTALAASLIAQQLGADRWGQLLAAVAALTIPVGILQGSTAQNADVVAFWMMCSAYFFLALRNSPGDVRPVPFALGFKSSESLDSAPQTKNGHGPRDRIQEQSTNGEKQATNNQQRTTNNELRLTLLLSASVGLAILTKGTAYVFLSPLAVWYIIWAARRYGRGAWRPVALIATIVVALNAPYLYRNLNLFGVPFGPESGLYTNEIFGVRPLLSNLVRNIALHFGSPSGTVNNWFESAIREFHSLLGVNVSDPRTTWINHVFHVNPMSTRESIAGNPIHSLLIFASAAGIAFSASLRRNKTIVSYLAMVLGGFLLFCFYLKWQPWNSRLHQPFFALCCPIIGLVLSRMLPRWAAALAGAALIVAALPWILNSETRPVFGAHSFLTVPRSDQYFNALPSIEQDYLQAARVVGGRCSSIGLYWGNVSYSFQYPLWISLRAYSGSDLRVEDVVVDNASVRLESQAPFAAFQPCAVLDIAVSNPGALTYHGTRYIAASREGMVSVLLPAGTHSPR